MFSSLPTPKITPLQSKPTRLEHPLMEYAYPTKTKAKHVGPARIIPWQHVTALRMCSVRSDYRRSANGLTLRNHVTEKSKLQSSTPVAVNLSQQHVINIPVSPQYLQPIVQFPREGRRQPQQLISATLAGCSTQPHRTSSTYLVVLW